MKTAIPINAQINKDYIPHKPQLNSIWIFVNSRIMKELLVDYAVVFETGRSDIILV